MRTFALGVAALAFWPLLWGCSDDPVDRQPLAALPTLAPVVRPSPPPAYTAVPLGTGVLCADRDPLNVALAESLVEVMEEYAGTWSFALYDLECDVITTVNPEYLQYPASASKIIPVIAVMRAVEAGFVPFEEVEPLIAGVLMWSSDSNADELETYVTAEDLTAVLVDAGIQDASYINESWHHTFMSAADMARVWGALVRGNLLGVEGTDYLLREARLAEVPAEYETWPSARPELEGFEFGQKAGYWVSDGVPYDFAGAGFLLDAGNPGASFVPIVFLQTENEDLLDPQRRAIWPLVEEHIRAVRLLGPAPAPTTAVP